MGSWIVAAFKIGSAIWKIGTQIFDAFEYVNTIVTRFLDVIHFDTIMRISQIAEVISPKYRGIMNRVYGEISAFSESIGFGPQGLALALENTRAIVMDISAMKGESYDIASVYWLSDLHDVMKKMADYSRVLAMHPELLFDFLVTNVEKRRYEQGREYSQTLGVNVKNLLERTKGFVDDIDTLGRDLRTFRNDLPESVRKLVDPLFKHVLDPVENWKTDTFNPLKKDYEELKIAWGKKTEEQDLIARDFANRLKKPGQLLGAIWNLPDEERELEEKITDIVVASELNRTVEREYTYKGVTSSALGSVIKALSYKGSPPEWFKGEMPGIIFPVTIPGQTRASPFVGDY